MNIYQFMSESPVLTFFLVMGPIWGAVTIINRIMRAANMIQDATHRLELLFGQGYGTNLDRLIEALEKKEAKP